MSGADSPSPTSPTDHSAAMPGSNWAWPTREPSIRSTGMGLVLAGLGVLVFSFSLPLTKIAVRGLDPTVAAIGRAAVASVLAVIALLIGQPPRPTRRPAMHLMPVMGGVIFGFPLLVAYALRRTESLHGS